MATELDEDESEVVFKGSPLYGHLQDLGLLDDEAVEERVMAKSTEDNVEEDTTAIEESTNDTKDSELETSSLLCSAKSFMWPNENQLILEVKVARSILESELLVQEDEEFLNNFVLNEEILAEYHRLTEDKPSHFSSLLSDVVLFSGSVAAMAGAVLYLSEKAKAATAAAAILPTALAAMTSVRIGSKVSSENDAQHFYQIVDLLLTDMKFFKQLVRKSLNLLQGMEVISQGKLLSVDPSTGASMVSTSATNGAAASSNTHIRQPCQRTDFPALRQAALKCTLQIIDAYRTAVGQLMEVSPLADHVDLQEHYIAFVDLDNFGLQDLSQLQDKDSPPIAIRELKETAQIALVQQSEYLRRFSLSFCERVRDDHVLNKAGLLKHIRDLLVTIRKVNEKLSRVLEYHQAMGIDMDKLEEPNKSLAVKPTATASLTQSISQHKSVPLRSIYTSMFSTGLHLQHSLIKLRNLEKVFEDLEKTHKRKTSSRRGRTSPPIPVDEVKLLQWLGDFQEIQTELNACIGCLDGGVSQIGSLRQDAAPTATSNHNQTVIGEESTNYERQDKPFVRNDDPPDPTFDQVFEAYLAAGNDESHLRPDESFPEEGHKEMKKQSAFLMRELKGVLVHKAKETELREAEAIARWNKDPFLASSQTSSQFSGFEDSFVQPQESKSSSSSSSTSVLSDCPTVKSASPKKLSDPVIITAPGHMARSVSGQLLETDTDGEDADDDEDVGTTSESWTRHENGNDNLMVPSNGVRSVSTPDLKSIDPFSASYKNFASNNGKEAVDTDEADTSSSEWESADELENNHRPLKSYRRPLRPAAATAASSNTSERPASAAGLESRKKKLRRKRERNRSNVYEEQRNVPTYLRLKESENLSFPDQRSTVFDGGLAAEAARRALAFRSNGSEHGTACMTEEFIGSDGSEASS